MLTSLITALVLGVFVPVVQATTGTADEVRSRVVVDVYVKEGASDSERAALETRLQTMANVKSVEYIPKEEALEIMSERNNEAFALLGSNPLPDSFRVTPSDPDGVGEIASALTGPGQLAAVDEVRNRRQDTDKIVNATGLVKGVTAGLAILFVIASMALVANTIRLSIFARRREVEVMKLVGATNWFVRWPFMLEGILCGAIGAVAAIMLLVFSNRALQRAFDDGVFDGEGTGSISLAVLAAILLMAGLALGAAGSGLTMRKFLRV